MYTAIIFVNTEQYWPRLSIFRLNPIYTVQEHLQCRQVSLYDKMDFLYYSVFTMISVVVYTVKSKVWNSHQNWYVYQGITPCILILGVRFIPTNMYYIPYLEVFFLWCTLHTCTVCIPFASMHYIPLNCPVKDVLHSCYIPWLHILLAYINYAHKNTPTCKDKQKTDKNLTCEIHTLRV